jgi:hypothetical protein
MQLKEGQEDPSGWEEVGRPMSSPSRPSRKTSRGGCCSTDCIECLCNSSAPSSRRRPCCVVVPSNHFWCTVLPVHNYLHSLHHPPSFPSTSRFRFGSPFIALRPPVGAAPHRLTTPTTTWYRCRNRVSPLNSRAQSSSEEARQTLASEQLLPVRSPTPIQISLIFNTSPRLEHQIIESKGRVNLSFGSSVDHAAPWPIGAAVVNQDHDQQLLTWREIPA